MDPLAALAKALQGGIGSTIYDIVPHSETAPGLRPQDDTSTELLRQSLRSPAVGQVTQAALRAPGTISVQTGDPSMWSLPGLSNYMDNMTGMATLGTTAPTDYGSSIGLYPAQAAMVGKPLATMTVPHELIHALRVNTGTNTGYTPFEEALARLGSGQPVEEWPAEQQKQNNPQLQNVLTSLMKNLYK
jgi:hypothetical protein